VITFYSIIYSGDMGDTKNSKIKYALECSLC